MTYDYDKIKAELKASISPKRYEHSLGVMDTAAELAGIYGCDVERARIAGLLHDCGKLTGQKIGSLEHAGVGARLISEKYGVTDSEIQSSILYHTTGRENMTMLEKIIYIADKIEPGRAYDGVDDIRKKAYNDIDGAIIDSLQNTVDYLGKIGVDVDGATIDTLSYLKKGGEALGVRRQENREDTSGLR